MGYGSVELLNIAVTYSSRQLVMPGTKMTRKSRMRKERGENSKGDELEEDCFRTWKRICKNKTFMREKKSRV